MRRIFALLLPALTATAFAQLPTALSDIPTSAPKEFSQEYTKLVSDGPKLVADLVPHIKTEKDDNDAKARFAISGLVWQTGKTGTDAQKKALGQALLDGVAKAKGDLPKVFLLEQLQYISDPSFAANIAEYLADEALANQALRTLTVTNPEDLGAILLKALPAAPPRTQVGILRALGETKPQSDSDAVAKLLTDDDPEIKAAALQALATWGDPSDEKEIKSALTNAEGFHGALAPAIQLRYAKALAQNNHAGEAGSACREVLAQPDSRENAHLKSAALEVLVSIEAERALPDLITASTSDHEEIRVPALGLAAKLGATAAPELIKGLKSAPAPQVAADIVLALGQIDTAEAQATVREAIKSEDASVRLASVKAAGASNRTNALPAYMEALQNADKQLAAAIAEQLARADTAALRAQLATAIDKAGPEGKTVLIEQIVSRRFSDLKDQVFALTSSEDAQTRTAAFKGLESISETSDLPRLLDMMLSAEKAADRNAARRAYVATARQLPEGDERTALLVEKYAAASDEQKARILETLPNLASPNALELIKKATAANSGDIKDAAIRALSEWPTHEAVPDLEKYLTADTEQKHKVLAIRGFVRLAASEEDDKKKLDMLKKALAATDRPDEQKLVISGLCEVHNEQALTLVAPFLDNPELQGEASTAVAKIAVPQDKDDKGLVSGAVASALVKALDHISDPDLKKKADDHLKSLEN